MDCILYEVGHTCLYLMWINFSFYKVNPEDQNMNSFVQFHWAIIKVELSLHTPWTQMGSDGMVVTDCNDRIFKYLSEERPLFLFTCLTNIIIQTVNKINKTGCSMNWKRYYLNGLTLKMKYKTLHCSHQLPTFNNIHYHVFTNTNT